MTWIHDGTICQISKSEENVKMLRAWARCIAFATDLASKDELNHALDHFRRIRDFHGQINYVGIDAQCVEMIHDELAYAPQVYELKLASGKVVMWRGRNAENAARRYVDAHRDAVIIATRPDHTPQIRVGYAEIIE